MHEGFVELSREEFFSFGWQALKSFAKEALRVQGDNEGEVEAVRSNWKKMPRGERPLRIEWGWKRSDEREARILAITEASEDWERHWVDSEVLDSRRQR